MKIYPFAQPEIDDFSVAAKMSDLTANDEFGHIAVSNTYFNFLIISVL